MLCSDWAFSSDATVGATSRNLDAELHILRDVVCSDPLQTEWGNKQYEWIKETMNEWE